MPGGPYLTLAKVWGEGVPTSPQNQAICLAIWISLPGLASFCVSLPGPCHRSGANPHSKESLGHRWRRRRTCYGPKLKAKIDTHVCSAHTFDYATARWVGPERTSSCGIGQSHHLWKINQLPPMFRSQRRSICSHFSPLHSSIPTLKDHGETRFRLQSKQPDQGDGNRPTHSAPAGRPYSLPRTLPVSNISKLATKQQSTNPSDDETEHHAKDAARPLLLTFDAFDTLYTPKDPIHEQYCALARNHGFTFTPDQLKPAFKAAFVHMSSQHPNYGKASGMSPRGWWIQLMKQTFRPLLAEHYPHRSLPVLFYRGLYNRFATKDGYDLYPEVTQLLSMIGLRSYQKSDWPPRRTMLGIVTNSDPRVRSVITSFKQLNSADTDSRHISIKPALFPSRFAPTSPGETPTVRPAHFAFATISYEVDVSKPNPAMFDRAADDAQEALRRIRSHKRLTRSGADLLIDASTDFHKMHVGDDLEKDVIPALKAGWDAILLDRTAEALISQRTVDIGKVGARKTSITVPVINNLLALQRLVSCERIEKFRRDRMTGGISKSSSMERSMQELWQSLERLGYIGDEAPDDRTEDSISDVSAPLNAESIAEESAENRKLPPKGYYEGKLEKEISDLFEDEDVPPPDSATGVDSAARRRP